MDEISVEDMKENINNHWVKRVEDLFVGRTITKVSLMSDGHMKALGWEPNKAIVFELDNGMYFFASTDSEGNGPGALFTSSMRMNVVPSF